MHIADLVAHAHKFHNEAILLVHFSPRCGGGGRSGGARALFAGAGTRGPASASAAPPARGVGRPAPTAPRARPRAPRPCAATRAPPSSRRWRPTCRPRCAPSACRCSTGTREGRRGDGARRRRARGARRRRLPLGGNATPAMSRRGGVGVCLSGRAAGCKCSPSWGDPGRVQHQHGSGWVDNHPLSGLAVAAAAARARARTVVARASRRPVGAWPRASPGQSI